MEFGPDACDRIVKLGELNFTVHSELCFGLPIVTIDAAALSYLTMSQELASECEGKASVTTVENAGDAGLKTDAVNVSQPPGGTTQGDKFQGTCTECSIPKLSLTGSFASIVRAAKPIVIGNYVRHLRLWLSRKCDMTELGALQSLLAAAAAVAEDLTEPAVGQACMSLYNGDWYRAEVTVVASGVRELLFVDFGIEQKVPMADLSLKKLPDSSEFYRTSFAFQCILACGDHLRFVSNVCDLISDKEELKCDIPGENLLNLPVAHLSDEFMQSVIVDCDKAAPNGYQGNANEALSADTSGLPDDAVSKSEPASHGHNSPAENNEALIVRRPVYCGSFSGLVIVATPFCDDMMHLHLRIQRSCDLAELNALQSLVELEATSADDLTNPQVGQFCIGLYEGGWYRAEVNAVTPDAVRVLFVDYGNEEEAPLSELQLKTLPQRDELFRDSLAFECILTCPDNFEFAPDACDKLLEQTELEFTVLRDAYSALPTISIASEILQSLTIGKDVVTAQASGVVDGCMVVASEDMNGHANDISKTDIKSHEISRCVRRPVYYASLLGVATVVVPVEDDASHLRLWIQRVSDEDELNALQSLVELEAASAGDLTNPQVGQFCIGLYEGGWYRAEVKAVTPDAVRVLFVDYGNEEEAPLSELQLKTLPQRDELFRDSLAFECILTCSDNFTFAPDACVKLLEEQVLEFTVLRDMYSALPTVRISCDILRSLTYGTGVVTAHASDFVTSFEEEMNEVMDGHAGDIPRVDIESNDIRRCVRKPEFSGSFIGVVTVAVPVEDDASHLRLWIQRASDDDKLNALQSLVELEATSADDLTNPQVGQFCISLYEGGWYRAEVKAVTPDAVRVLFVDYGNEEEAPLSELQLKTLPQRDELFRDSLAFECILTCPDNFELAPDACDKIVKHTENVEFTVLQEWLHQVPIVTADCSSFVFPAAMSLTGASGDVIGSTASMANLLDFPQPATDCVRHENSDCNGERKWTVKRSVLSGLFSGVVSVAMPIAGDRKHLRLWIHRSCDVATLVALQSLLQLEASSADYLTCPEIEEFCLALHNGQWYRAEVKAVASEAVLVQLVDYGNEVMASPSKLQLKLLRQQEELYRESLAFECILDCTGTALSSSTNVDVLDRAGLPTADTDPGRHPNVTKGCNDAQIDYISVGRVAVTSIEISGGDDQNIAGDKITNMSVKRPGFSGSFPGLAIVASPFSDDPSHLRLWVQRSCDLDELNALQSLVELEAASAEDLTNPQVGQFCIGLYEGGWYRAEVKAVTPDAVRVLFVDYGNEEEAPLVELQLKTLPQRDGLFRDSLAFECILTCPDNFEFSPDACDKIMNHELSGVTLLQQEVVFNLPSLRVSNDLSQSILVPISCKQRRSPNKPVRKPRLNKSFDSASANKENICCESACEAAAISIGQISCKSCPRLQYTPEEMRAIASKMPQDHGEVIAPCLPPSGRHCAAVLPASVRGTLVVQLLPKWGVTLFQLSQEMNRWYTDLCLLARPISLPRPGKIVAFRWLRDFGGDGSWIRGRLVSIASDGEAIVATVAGVDIGRLVHRVPLFTMRELAPGFADWPELTLVCRLVDSGKADNGGESGSGSEGGGECDSGRLMRGERRSGSSVGHIHLEMLDTAVIPPTARLLDAADCEAGMLF